MTVYDSVQYFYTRNALHAVFFHEAALTNRPAQPAFGFIHCTDHHDNAYLEGQLLGQLLVQLLDYLLVQLLGCLLVQLLEQQEQLVERLHWLPGQLVQML